MPETVNNRNVNAEISFLSDETWQHLGCISALKRNDWCSPKPTPVKFILYLEINFEFVCAAPYSVG